MDKEVREFPGLEGNDCRIDNAVKIERGQSINGSADPNAFGGAKSWPCLRIEANFPVGQEAGMDRIASKIEELLRAEAVILDGNHKAREQGHWAHGTCYGCGEPKLFGGLCSDCKGYCKGCGKLSIRGELYEKCRPEKFSNASNEAGLPPGVYEADAS